MKNAGALALCGSVVGRYAAVAILLALRAHYFVTVIVAPVMGWR
jgi:hypothetical protein